MAPRAAALASLPSLAAVIAALVAGGCGGPAPTKPAPAAQGDAKVETKLEEVPRSAPSFGERPGEMVDRAQREADKAEAALEARDDAMMKAAQPE